MPWIVKVKWAEETTFENNGPFRWRGKAEEFAISKGQNPLVRSVKIIEVDGDGNEIENAMNRSIG